MYLLQTPSIATKKAAIIPKTCVRKDSGHVSVSLLQQVTSFVASASLKDIFIAFEKKKKTVFIENYLIAYYHVKSSFDL